MPRNFKSPMALAPSMKRNTKSQPTGKTEPSSGDDLTPEQRAVKPHQRCPVCWNNPEYRGKGKRKWRRQINGPVHERCYKCDQCGTEFIRQFREEVDDNDCVTITSKTIEVRPSDEGQRAAGEIQTNESQHRDGSGESDEGRITENSGEARRDEDA